MARGGVTTNDSYTALPGLQHGVLEELAQEVRVAPGDGSAWLELFLLHGLRHPHEKLRHLRQRQVDLHALVLQGGEVGETRRQHRGRDDGGFRAAKAGSRCPVGLTAMEWSLPFPHTCIDPKEQTFFFVFGV